MSLSELRKDPEKLIVASSPGWAGFQIGDIVDPRFYCWLGVGLAGLVIIGVVVLGIVVLGYECVLWLKIGEWKSFTVNDWILTATAKDISVYVSSLDWMGLRKVLMWLLMTPGWITVPVTFWLVIGLNSRGLVALADEYEEVRKRRSKIDL